MKVVTNTVAGSVEILAVAQGALGRPYTITSASVSAAPDGRKIAKAGTPYPANTSAVLGILHRDVDVTDGDAVVTLIYAGTIDEAKAKANSGVTIAAAAKSALPRITFM